MRHRTTCVLAVLFMAGCTAPPPPPPRWVAHAGCGAGCEAPANTALAVLQAMVHRVDGIELDVQLSADDALIAFHPDRLETATNGRGLVNERAWADLRRLSLADRPEARLARVEDLLRLDSTGTLHWVLDIKLFAAGDWVPYLDRFAEVLRAFEAGGPVPGRVRVECRDLEFLTRLRRRAPHLELGLVAPDPITALGEAKGRGFQWVVLPPGRANKAVVQAAHRLGLRVSTYGASARSELRTAWAAGVDEVQLDDPSALPVH
ncbi:MAG TPA: glycerophosphodiester phosphodiesterase [Flavobacteriales bacterium]|nr:glycerophosphodiester phosphodiesterase [Flavobacteriales bacterium]